MYGCTLPSSPPSMKFVALISGGKDSFFNILHCVQNGHELVALANLHPADASVNETDSFMFQTVGHDIIDFYRDCVPEIPLYRKALNGGSTNVSLEYVPTPHDEIEDLLELLQEVKRKQPDVEGVSCGAILSHYQRTRVENVCDRLGLTSLAYLWQRDQAELMREICGLGLDARLIKVAAIGLNEKHLGKPLAEMYPILTKLNQMYDVHVCGEGGEFESLVFDAPFFQRKLALAALEPVRHSSDALYLRMKITVEEKNQQVNQENIPTPPLLLENFAEIAEIQLPSITADTAVPSASFRVSPRVSKLGGRLFISNLVSTKDSIEEQTSDALEQLRLEICARGYTMANVQHVCLLVSDMAHFSRVNSVYGKFFEDIHLPPSRVCVETVLPQPYRIQMSCVVMPLEHEKMGIHIRSRSYWAPQNIGPYSQAIVDHRGKIKNATLSGQIPLVPASMQLDTSMSNTESAVLALQHLYRAKTLVDVKQFSEAICFVTNPALAPLLAQIWQLYVDDVEYGQDFYNRLLIVQVTNLPRNANVEWGGSTFEKIRDMYEDEEETGTSLSYDDITEKFKTSVVAGGDTNLVKLVTDDISAVIEFLRNPRIQDSYVRVIAGLDDIHRLTNMGLSAEWIPVLKVWDSDATPCSFALLWVE